MPKINSSAELEALRKDVLSSRDPLKPCIAVCTGSGCLALGAANLVTALRAEIAEQGVESRIDIRETGCPGFCERGPLIVVYPDETCYLKVQPSDAKEVVESVLEKTVIDRLLYVDPATGERLVHEMDIPFYKNQQRLLIGNNIKLDPTSIEDYLAVGVYAALEKVACRMKPEEVVALVNRDCAAAGGAAFLPAASGNSPATAPTPRST